jgi:UDP-3-O-[3-hydroxymyristoyl] glucosamine N-acyltransferase
MRNIYTRRWESPIGDHDRIGPNCKIGKNVKIGNFTIVEDGCVICDNVFIGHLSVLRNNVTVGENSIIGHLVMIESDAWIGKNSTIQSQCHITKFARIDDHVFLGPKAMLINTNRISHGRGFEPELRGPQICFAARIGSGSVIMPGRVIGKNASVGAGSVVTHDVPSGEVWVGNPARFKRLVPEKEIFRI